MITELFGAFAFIENLSATNDQFSCIDLTDNDISKLENLP